MPKEIKVHHSHDVYMHPQHLITYRVMGDVREIVASTAPSRAPITRKITADWYVDLRTGEAIEVSHASSRADNLCEVSRSLKRGRDMINANITRSDIKRVRWCTLTYAENMTDSKRLYKDFDRLRKMLQRRYGKFEYISCAEPQGRGAWHLHILLIFPSDAPYIPNEVLRECWGQGFVSVKALPDGCDNIGAYLTAYLGDIPLEEGVSPPPSSTIKEVEVTLHSGATEKKKFIKGGRLKMYPRGMQIFRFSRGLKKPEEFDMLYEDAKKILGAATPRYSSSTAVSVDGKYCFDICYEQYNISER